MKDCHEASLFHINDMASCAFFRETQADKLTSSDDSL